MLYIGTERMSQPRKIKRRNTTHCDPTALWGINISIMLNESAGDLPFMSIYCVCLARLSGQANA